MEAEKVGIQLDIRWEGLEDVLRYLAKTIPEAFEEAALTALNLAAAEARDYAKMLCPVDTGALRKSIRVEPTAHREGGYYEAGVTAGGGGVINPKTGREVDYAAYVELGTSRTPPQPYLMPAIHTVLPRVAQYLLRTLRRLIQVG